MTTLTIRNLDERVKQALRKRAAANGVSMEQEVRTIIGEAVRRGGEGAQGESLMASINRLKAKYGAFELEIPERSSAVREPPKFE
ncbi:FitA-like ribbon-helix-helix domain-containing protein [Pseudaminobacter sp. NGMCC 1.201702]|uniref:FitA-like ribbon-helix-helix domain-containing protein n=1 Tax=Pseudaminobacter sp. NGMCC 1.201702 TaxID=3391825 RepID=UPI0039EE2C53